jgi:methionyl-tRNA formyltransferase
MKILFWGTPAYAVPSLDALVAAGHQVVGVVSQPDRRRGRGKELVPSPVKARALALDLPVFTPERIRSDTATQQQLAALGADLFVVVAFGQILPPAVLDLPPLGCWNGHGSLLPRWRGAGPIQWSLLEGDPETGVGIMAMEEGLDTGPVLLERRLPIGLLENAHQLAEKLAQLTATLLVEAMPLIAQAGTGLQSERWGRLGLKPQSPDGMTYARQLKKDDYRLDWAQPGLSVHRKVMGLYPGTYTLWQGKRLKLLASEPLIRRLASEVSEEARPLVERWGLPAADGPTPPALGSGGSQTPSSSPGSGSSSSPGSSSSSGSSPGTVLAVESGLGLVVATGGCPVLIRSAQLEGKAPASGQTLIQQLGMAAGERFDATPGDQTGVAS